MNNNQGELPNLLKEKKREITDTKYENERIIFWG